MPTLKINVIALVFSLNLRINDWCCENIDIVFSASNKNDKIIANYI
jgi:hypothetical protein